MHNKITDIIIASDHAGVTLKNHIIEYLKQKQYKVIDLGTDNAEISVDYPDYADKAALALNDNNMAILICGSGIGINIAANRHKNVRAALCYNEEITKLAREHNDANIIVLGARFIDKNTALKIIDIFINTEFEGGRHLKRTTKLSK